MYGNTDAGIKARIEKDIAMFDTNIRDIKANPADKGASRVLALSRMYASDARSYLDKGDMYTSFSCISYAHGLLDAIRTIAGVI